MINPDRYVTGEKARKAFNKCSKVAAWYIIPFERSATVKSYNNDNVTAEQIEKEIEIYIVAKDFSWTYIKTHEGMCGPYYFKR